MNRISLDPRPGWEKKLEDLGVHFHTLGGVPYWDESAAYQLTTFEVDQLELATNTLHDMCLELVREIIENRQFNLFLIPRPFEELIIRSWERNDPTVYGRFDLAYDGVGAPKMLEYNADTPTSLVEAAVAQWYWLKDIDERGDQFNSIHERLIEAWRGVHVREGVPVHFAALEGQMEDYVTVEYLRDTAIQAGLATEYLDIEKIGVDHRRGCFVDLRGEPIECLFKLYPWEWLLREEFGRFVPKAQLTWIEPPWKMLLSCKSILPLLWERFPESPFLLPASFSPLDGDYVRKPVHAREGANIQVVKGGQVILETEGPYGDGPFVYQRLAPIRSFDDKYPVFGSWIVDKVSCGVGVREGDALITQNTSRFVPHQMVS